MAGGGQRIDMNILALDMATKTGWAAKNMSGTENFKKRLGESRGMLFIRFEVWVNDMIRMTSPELVVYERPHARGRAANEVLNGLLAFLTAACERHGVEYTDCPSTTLKKFATGKGNASKQMMMDAYEERWGECPVDDNEADARWLHEWAKEQF
jgi:crossover junction endodeoxyribonuclease RuvC